MASIFFATRGIHHVRDLFIDFMKTQPYNFPLINNMMCKCGHRLDEHKPEFACKKFEPREENVVVQGALRPIELWEYCLPEQFVPEILWYLGYDGTGNQVHDHEQGLKKLAWVFQKGLKLDKLPTFDKDKLMITKRLIPRDALSIYMLGYKKDAVKNFPWGYEQEGL